MLRRARRRFLYWNQRRLDIIDRWYGTDYRYVKVKDNDGGLYILRLDERRNEWALIMFVSGLAVSNANRMIRLYDLAADFKFYWTLFIIHSSGSLMTAGSSSSSLSSSSCSFSSSSS
jgi:hypothetical protein